MVCLLYYKDGSVVEWAGDEGAKTPHSITDIVAGTTAYDHDGTAKKEETKTEAAKTTDTDESISLPLCVP